MHHGNVYVCSCYTYMNNVAYTTAVRVVKLQITKAGIQFVSQGSTMLTCANIPQTLL